MIQKALEYIVGLRTPYITTIEGHAYSDKALDLVKAPIPEPLKTSTLQSVVDFITATGAEGDRTLAMIHIVSPSQVRIVSRSLRPDGHREVYLIATCSDTSFDFCRSYGQEDFIVNVQTKFFPDDDFAELLKLVGTIRGEDVSTSTDDGVTQMASFKTGKAFVASAPVKNPWYLSPYRTFPEIAQPRSTFFLRLKTQQGGPLIALNEVADCKWEREAVVGIAAWFSDKKPANEYPIIM